MRIINDLDIITPTMSSVTDVLLDIAPVLAVLAGIILAVGVIDIIISYFDGSQGASITVAGKNLTQADINDERVMPMSWYKSLSVADQKRIADFDHEQARKKYSKMTQ